MLVESSSQLTRIGLAWVEAVCMRVKVKILALALVLLCYAVIADSGEKN